MAERKEMMKAAPGPENQMLVPPVDICEEKEGIYLLADMPGVRKEDLDIQVDKGLLTIEGRVTPMKIDGAKELYREFPGGGYRRVFTLGPDVEPDRIEAKMHSGVLKLFLPKREAVRPKKIEVKMA